MKNNIEELDIITLGQQVLDVEISVLQKLRSSLDSVFADVVDILASTSGKVILTGVGKSGLVARKIASTLSSTGTPSFFLHPTEASHGDLGVVAPNDTVMALSNSGESDELLSIIPFIIEKRNTLISVCGNKNSPLARMSSININLEVEKEACILNISPTSSTTAQIALGDALAIAVMFKKQFSKTELASIHPGGSIGKALSL